MSKYEKVPSQFQTLYPNYSRDLWEFLRQEQAEENLETYGIMLDNLRRYSNNELISMKQLIKINARRHPLLKPLMNVLKTTVRLLASLGLFSIVFSSMKITTHIKFVFTEYSLIALFSLIGGYFLFLLIYELSIMYIEQKKWFYTKNILVELIDTILSERNRVCFEKEKMAEN